MKKSKPVIDPKTTPAKDTDKDTAQDNVKGYPQYPKKDDIYNRAKEVENINPDDLSKSESFNKKWEIDPDEELETDRDRLGDDLDVPGSELDDVQEEIGSEDEENNYYSIGGDNHDDLEES